MCGLFARLDLAKKRLDEHAFSRILGSLQHRGPDGEGRYEDPEHGVTLCHRRLAIIDPERGAQPMLSDDGALAIVFNGAIYNYMELRRVLIERGHPIKSYSDTEVLLYAYREWGERCVDRLLGMFAFAIWDKRQRRLLCARDRIGIKPMYCHFDGTTLTIASEIKAILASGAAASERDDDALQDYLSLQFCLGGKTLFRNIRQLEPGHLLRVELDREVVAPQLIKYWDLAFEIDTNHDERWFIDQLGGLIEDSVRIHLRSDVPLGAHLSGGLDSSAIVCVAAPLLKGESLKTFSGTFPEGDGYDETAYAKLVASQVGAEYHEIAVDGRLLAETLPKLIYFMDEPTAGPGLVPQYFVSRLAAQHVKVVLGGQGGDELFIGYARYLVAYLEQCLRGEVFEIAPPGGYPLTLGSIGPNLSMLKTYTPMLQHFFADGLFGPVDERYFRLIDRRGGTSRLVPESTATQGYSTFEAFREIFNRDGIDSLVNKMTYFDLKASLPALLQVEDRTSMAVGIESRVPLLDHRIVEFMATVPPNIKFSGGRMKHLFKEAVRSTVPEKVFARKDKMGFPTPLTLWASGVAREFVRETLLSERARQRGLYNTDELELTLDDPGQSCRGLWGLLCLELWHRVHLDNDRPAYESWKVS
jgi:asparagine synthase (glutamine-hydrolysing)